MSRALRIFVASASLFAGLSLAQPEEPDHAIHQELRALLRKVEASVNAGKYDEMADCFHERVRATTITQEVILSRSEVAPYFRKWFGPGGFLAKLQMTLTADALTELGADKTWGVVRGSGQEDYTLANGRFYPMRTRWTATVVKDADGAWRILAIHVGTSFLDNPVLERTKSAIGWAAGAGFLAGALAAAAVAAVLSRRRRAAAAG